MSEKTTSRRRRSRTTTANVRADTVRAGYDRLSAADVDPFMRMMLYGPSGAGKTYLAATAAWVEQMSPVLILDNGTSTDTILGDPDFEGVEIIRVYDFLSYNKLYTELSPLGSNLIEQFRTVVVDELDSAHWMAMQYLAAQGVIKAEEKDRERADYEFYQEDYGDGRVMIRKLVQNLLKLDCHLIINCLAKEKKDPDDKVTKMLPSIAGQLAGDIPALLGTYAYLDIEAPSAKEVRQGADPEGERILYFTPTRRFRAKVRGRRRAERLTGSMLDPTMPKIYSLYFDEGE